MQGYIDCHSHTVHSPDGSDSVIQMCTRAMELSLEAYAITDHCEMNQYVEDGYDKRIAACISDVRAAKSYYKNELNLLLGIELGQPLQNLALSERVLSETDYDIVLGSLHNIEGYEDFAFLDYARQDVHTLIGRYYSELYEMALWGKFDVLAHLTYPLRYIKGVAKMEVDMAQFEEKIRAIFQALVRQGIGIEINSSGLRQHLRQTMPDLYYVKMYRECGGEILTLGSDAHRAVDLAKGIPEALEIAKAAGFTEVAYYKNRTPQFIKI